MIRVVGGWVPHLLDAHVNEHVGLHAGAAAAFAL
jgi:hypothetical protein